MFRAARIPVIAGLAIWLAFAGPSLAQEQSDIRAVLELSQQFYYADDPFFVRLSITNEGDTQVSNPVKTPLFKAFDVRVAGGEPLAAEGKPDVNEPARPGKLSPKGFYGTVVDLAGIYPGLKKPGTYEIRWEGDGVASQVVLVRIIPKYDPGKDYVARIETDMGVFVVDFFKEASPIAVKAFVDLANTGFYDGLLFHEVRPDWYVSTGDPMGDGTGMAPFRYPAELSEIPIVAGTVLLKPVSASPPANSSQFVISLKPFPEWTGQFTVLGQIVEGLEVLKKISRQPTSQNLTRPFFKPLKDLRMARVAIMEKPSAAGTP